MQLTSLYFQQLGYLLSYTGIADYQSEYQLETRHMAAWLYIAFKPTTEKG